jgi:hypothetical protein
MLDPAEYQKLLKTMFISKATFPQPYLHIQMNSSLIPLAKRIRRR